jgi:hypothetical protein
VGRDERPVPLERAQRGVNVPEQLRLQLGKLRRIVAEHVVLQDDRHEGLLQAIDAPDEGGWVERHRLSHSLAWLAVYPSRGAMTAGEAHRSRPMAGDLLSRH